MIEIDQRVAVQPRSIASTPYDTAWVAAIPHPQERRDPRFPTALNWICQNQWPDGSWGSAIPYLHDRVICTVAALIPLVRYGQRQTDYQQVIRGERYLWQNAQALENYPCELVGFELLLPALVDNAVTAGVKLPPYIRAFEKERERKLKMLPEQMIYSNQVTVAHSLEFLGATVDPIRLAGVQGANGSIGNSPAATAFFLHFLDDPEAVAYIERCLAADEGTAVSVLDPCETFDDLWTAQHRWLGGEAALSILSPELRQTLQVGLNGKGVSLSPSFPVPDADETAVALVLFKDAGLDIEPTALKEFERDDYFVSFQYERHPSVGVNIHALMALLRYPQYPGQQAAIAKVIAFLGETRQQNSFWLDKWHISPHYATGRAVVALLELDRTYPGRGQELLQPALAWILETQNEDGSWGYFGIPTVEETAYATLALEHIQNPGLRIRTAIENGVGYIQAHLNEPRPAMWIDKCLYLPSRIVESAIYAALGRRASTNPTH